MSFKSNPAGISGNVAWHRSEVSREQREALNAHRGAIIWFTGFSGAGKSTLAHAVEKVLHSYGCQTYVLDGDNVRHGLCGDLGFSESDRQENIRRVGEVAKLFMDAGLIVLAAFISPNRAGRDQVRAMAGPGGFMEVHCEAAVEVCEARDVKGLYKKARAGEIAEFTGISAPYEAPEAAELVLDTGATSLDSCVQQVIEEIMNSGICSRPVGCGSNVI